MKTLYIFGNEYLSCDSFAKELAKFFSEETRKVKIIQCASPDILLEAKEKEIWILDVVKNIKKPIIIDDISQLKTRDIFSMHDFDISFFLKLMQEMGIKKKIKIIGVPSKGDVNKIAKEVMSYL